MSFVMSEIEKVIQRQLEGNIWRMEHNRTPMSLTQRLTTGFMAEEYLEPKQQLFYEHAQSRELLSVRPVVCWQLLRGQIRQTSSVSPGTTSCIRGVV